MRLARRQMLATALAGAGAALLHAASGAAAAKPVRMLLPFTGSAGTVWRRLFDDLPASAKAGLTLDWIGGNPGQVQFQLLAGTLDVSVFGALGLAEARDHGSDVVIFGPALDNHGRWLVHAESPYRHPRDLIGKTIATHSEASETFKQARMAAALVGLDIKNDMQFIFGPPAANEALFERRDVEAVITLEPLATRLVARGAREIARVGEMWREGTGETRPPFLVGLAARRGWIAENPGVATQIGRLMIAANGTVRDTPEKLAALHASYGIPDSDTTAIALLPQRMADVYATEWDGAVFASIDRQVDTALRLGLIPSWPKEALYDRSVLAA